MSDAFRQLLTQEFAPFRTLSTHQLVQLERHFELMTAWNARLNLTRVSTLEESVRIHYAESLYLGQWLPAGAFRIADVGSGAGLPGIPIGILRPECRVTLIESHQRKAVFLREAARAIPSIDIVSQRAEAVRTQFDWIVSRAVRPEDVAALPNAPNKALLIGEEDAGKLGWQSHKLPWGQGRVLAFHVEHSANS